MGPAPNLAYVSAWYSSSVHSATLPAHYYFDPAIYERYVGRYELAPAFVLTITRDGDQIFAQATGQPRFEIFPSSETEFFFIFGRSKEESPGRCCGL